MKFKTTAILLAVFLALLAFVFFFESRQKSSKDEEQPLVNLPPEDVQKITLKKEGETISFQKDEKGDWLMSEPLEAKADRYEVDRLAEDFSGLRIERTVEEDAADMVKYGIPQKEILLWYKGKEQPVKIQVGMENPLDNSLFAKKEDDPRVVLISSHLKNAFDKKTFDFRQKDIFRFETGDVTAVRLRAKDIQWEAQKKEDEWHLQKPVHALAKKNHIDELLNALSGLKAKEFTSEEKKEEEMERFGLKSPEYEISLSIPKANQEAVFSLHKKEDKLYATTSLSSKIISIEDHILTSLGKKPEELRETEVVNFYTWEARKLFLKKGDVKLTLAKDKNDKWHFEGDGKEEADGSKVETFIRKIESLEAAEFIDPPFELKDYGQDTPQAEVTIWTGEEEKEAKAFTVFIGAEDKEKNQAIVRNPSLHYLFRVDAAFFKEFPKEAQDWHLTKKE